MRRPTTPHAAVASDAVVVLPTYNHGGTVVGVLERLVALGLRTIVVDDGSTDGTAGGLVRWLADHPGAPVEVVTHERNRGKAAALWTGFARAKAMGATHAATIDADAQLDPDDLPRLLVIARGAARTVVVGRRPERIEGCPARCRAGRSWASLAVQSQCGLRLSDTQCGLRVYPLDLFDRVRPRASRYAFEAEIITRAVWAGYKVVEAPVGCRYFPPGERVSHWRPLRDTFGQLSTHLGLVARSLAPIPRGAPRGTHPNPGAALGWLSPLRTWRELRSRSLAPLELAAALGIGVFIGTLPAYGLHTVTSLYVAWRLHLPPLALVLGSQISTPPVGLALAALSIGVGGFLRRGEWAPLAGVTWERAWSISGRVLLDWTAGSLVVGTAAALVAFAVALMLGRRVNRGVGA